MKKPYLRSILVFFILVSGQVLTGCSPEKQSATVNPIESTKTAELTSLTRLSTVFASLTPGKIETSTPPTILIPAFPTPQDPISSVVVQDGPFTFDIRFFRDAKFRNNPVAPSLYSGMEGIGIYFTWKYQGPDLPPPATVYWGIEPNIVELLQQSEYQTNGIKDGDSNGWVGGLSLPSGSKVGDQFEALIKIDAQGKSYGAVIRLSIQEGEKGFEPRDITVESLGLK